MFRANKIKNIAAIICASALILSGCADKPSAGTGQGSSSSKASSGGAAPVSSGSEIITAFDNYSYSPDKPKITVVRPNRIVFQETVDTGSDYNGSYYSLIGLKDEAVQEKINNAIIAKYCEFRDDSYLPGYIGIKRIQRDYGDSVHKTINAGWELWNNNDILSVSVSVYLDYTGDINEYGYSDTMYYGETFGMTFDLNTGEQLKITDIFRSDVDALRYINSKISEKIAHDGQCEDSYENDLLGMISEFKGITDEHNFYIDAWDGSLIIPIDYHDKEFLISSFPYYFSINNDDNVFDYDKYLSKEYLYTAPTSNRLKLLNAYPTVDKMSKIHTSCFEGRDSKYYNESLLQYDALTVYQNSLLRGDDSEILAMIPEFETKRSEYIEKYGEDNSYAYFLRSGYCNFIGNFRNLNYQVSAYVGSGEDNYYNIKDKYYCFRGNSDTPVTFEDLFKESIDPKNVLTSTIRLNLDRIDDIQIENIDELIERVLALYDGVQVYDTGLTLFYKCGIREIIEEYSQSEGEYYSILDAFNNLYFDDLGWEAMNF